MIRGHRVGLVLLAAAIAAAPVACNHPQDRSDKGNKKNAAGHLVRLTRLLFQDHRSSSLKWADVGLADDGSVSLDEVAEVAGFKPIDAGKQKLVQMQVCNGVVPVG